MVRTSISPNAPKAVPLKFWLSHVQTRVSEELGRSLDIPDEQGLDASWAKAATEVHRYTLRPAKRLRPALLVAGYGLGASEGHNVDLPNGVWRFAAGLELLHTFMLIHDDVADRAELRRGDLALHCVLGNKRMGEDLAVVAGDHLFARAIEVMLSSGLPRAARVVTWFLSVCRHTAVGQYLDLELAEKPLSEVNLWQTLKVAQLKTARYGFVAPLVCGAELAAANARTVEILERVGRHVGLAYQLRDDLIGVLGDPSVSGKPSDSDIAQGKRTFPLIAAYLRADAAGRTELEQLFEPGEKTPEQIDRARFLLRVHGGEAATQRAIARCTRGALRGLELLPPSPVTDLLHSLIAQLARRSA